MGNTFCQCWTNVCVSPRSVETRIVRLDQSSCGVGAEKVPEDRSAAARGHNEHDIVLEDVWPDQTLANAFPRDWEHKKQDQSKTRDVYKLDSDKMSDMGASTQHQPSDMSTSTSLQISEMSTSSPSQTTVANKRDPNQADSPTIDAAPSLIDTATVCEDEQTKDSVKAQEEQSLLNDDDGHLSEVQQLLLQKIEEALQAEMQMVFPQERVTSLLSELQATIESEIKLPFLQQIEYCALLDRQEAELKALDRQLQREKLDHDIMFVLSQDCSKPPGIKEGQAERFGKRRRQRRTSSAQNSEAGQGGGRRRRPNASVRRRKQVTGIMSETAVLSGFPDVSA